MRLILVSSLNYSMGDTQLDHVDPDANLLNEYLQSEGQSGYFSVNEFNEVSRDYSVTLSILNFNIRSCNRNLENFLTFMSAVDFNFLVYVFSESWYSNADDTLGMDGYHAHHSIRVDRVGGGVSVYCSDLLSSEKIEELSLVNGDIELCVVKLKTIPREIFIIAIYRPPSGTFDGFFGALAGVLNHDLLARTDIVVTGDLNINLLNMCDDENCNLLSSIMHSLSFIPLISKPTRFPVGQQQGNPSLLDHFWFNRLYPTLSGILTTDISDHMPTFLFVRNCKLSSGEHKQVFRDHSDVYYGKFCNLLSDWSQRFNLERNVSNLVETFVNELNDIYRKSFPTRTKYISLKRLSKPWLSNELLKCIKEKSRLYKLHKKNMLRREIYARYNNYVTDRLREAKKMYYDNCFKVILVISKIRGKIYVT